MSTMNEIDTLTRRYADARAAVAEIVAKMHEGIEAIKRDNLPALKRAIGRAAERDAELRALVEDAPQLFVKPRTVVMHGIKVGYQKGKGAITFTDADTVVRLIRKHLPEQADVLIKTTEKVVKAGLKELEVKDLKRIGCAVEVTGDMVVISPTDSDVDKLVTALLKGATESEEE